VSAVAVTYPLSLHDALPICLRAAAHEAARKAASALGLNEPLLVTTIKPEGTLSLLPTVSSGIHYSHAPYYVRRIRISSSDPLCRSEEHTSELQSRFDLVCRL